ncbi:MAG: UvrD-helicase domain-containing protein, partial [Candidatus Sumerlaeaceae bacterium]|nr:UvrD-helicase domain-containing protein [Candidatus Sumerlaeaceae bacterium]
MTKHWTESDDEAARCASLDTRRSFIVQAPAGSGKTELLIQRFLALLATVDEPGQVVAITFTRKAAGEMVDRILRAVHDAKGSPPKEPHQRRTWELGRAVLNRDRERDWSLLERPGQLRVQTIDAFCAAIVRQLPVTAGVGSSPQVIEDPTPYLREAARRVMYRLNNGDDLFPSLSNLLLHLDNDTEKVQRLMVAMLRARDQWLRHMPANGDMNRHREALEHSLRQFSEHHLSLLHEAFPATCRADFAKLIRFVAQNFERFDLNETALTYVDAPKVEEEEGFAEDSEQSDEDDTALADAEEPEEEEEGEGSAEDSEQSDEDDTALADAEWPEEEEEESTPSITFVKPADLAGFPEPSVEYLLVWKFAAEILLTKDGKFRKRFGARAGVSSPTSARNAKKQTVFEQMKGVATDLLDSLSQVPGLAELLNQVRLLPHGCYSSEQWKILKALLRVLPALNEALVQVFAEEGVLDFIEVAARARRALESPKATGLLEGIRHILVDEFQDTSFTQFDLLGLLTRTWASHGGQRTSRRAASNAKPTRTGASTDVPRTIFAVGDPMQSIYRFREAEVGLFLSTVSKKRLSGVPLAQALRLTRNFRSCENLIDWFDEIFSAIMPEAGQDDPVTGAVSFSPSVCGSGSQGGTVEVHPVFAASAREAGPLEAKMVADVVEKILERHAFAQKEDGRQRTTAILVRTRSHVPHIVRELRQRQIKYMAVEIDPLSERPAVLDLWALTRALVHPADRIAWLSILHAPWCG